ncbi:hypothetical protein HUK65_09715 [Rhodobacteraceae bacterium 2376]|uniref:Uncharacterized protein n=1 Tax=Rhabdonatronobacter sediminivivens TaxID=2743469 RepID=A0A7Z0L0H8_9RHOB|nr:hypothetical protein [Rhabdonatronobacter sediminivivens]NYS25268.1 hypothetical protein [Rhabdonatronobacter sediminivivens]
MTPPGHPDARAFAADRLLESERLALAAAGAPLALLLTQIGTIAGAGEVVRVLATVSILSFVYCCIWQVYIVNYATYWLAAARMEGDSPTLVGRGLISAFRLREAHTEEGLIRLIRLSRWHYSLAYWAGGVSGLGAALMVVWS